MPTFRKIMFWPIEASTSLIGGKYAISLRARILIFWIFLIARANISANNVLTHRSFNFLARWNIGSLMVWNIYRLTRSWFGTYRLTHSLFGTYIGSLTHGLKNIIYSSLTHGLENAIRSLMVWKTLYSTLTHGLENTYCYVPTIAFFFKKKKKGRKFFLTAQGDSWSCSLLHARASSV